MSELRSLPGATTRILMVAVIAALGVFTLPAPAFATVTVSRAELDDDRLRVDGRAAANSTITVDGVAMAASDGSGSFRISRSPYTPPGDCIIEVNDGSPSPTRTSLSGCTAAPAPPPPSSSTATILPDAATLGPAYVGAAFQDTAAQNLVSLGPDAVGPVRWEITAGALPAGLGIRVPEPAGRPPLVEPTFMYIEGIPTTVQTSTFTLRATDTNGLTASRSYTIDVQAARPLAITPQTWPPLRVGEGANLWFDGAGGVQPYVWAVSAGQLPHGMALVDDTAGDALVRVGGTPTTSGAFTWTMRLTDARGTQLDREFSVTVGAASAIASLTISPTNVTGGSSATGTVTLDQLAPAAGAEVTLISSHPQVASVNSQVFVIAAGTTASFPISTAAVSSSTTVTVTASYSGSTRSATLTVEPAAAPPPSPVAELTLSPSTVTGGDASSGTVRLGAPAPDGGAVVALSSSSGAAAVPAEVTVPAGATTAGFSVSTTAVPAPTSATVTAAYLESTVTAVLTVSPPSAPPPSLAAPSLLSPANGARWAPNQSRTFDWSDVAGAATYTVQVSTSSAFTSVQFERVVTTSQVALSFATEGDRFWRVRAHDSSANAGPWSSTRSFRVKR